MGLLIVGKYKQHIEVIQNINERITKVTPNTASTSQILVKVKKKVFSNLAENAIKIFQNVRIFVMGDLIARIRKYAMEGVTQKFNEENINENGGVLI